MEENNTVPSLPPPSTPTSEVPTEEKPSKPPVGLIVGGVIFLILLIVATVLLIRADNDTTGRVRDVFIIFMALESIIIGAALIVLVVQLATLINLLQNEIKPIINSTNETVNTLKGTVTFISDNLSEPVIKLNSYLAGIKTFFEVIKPSRPKR